MQHLVATRQNVVISHEALNSRFVPTIRDIVKDKDWDVQIVLGYRRIHEALPSRYNQQNKKAHRDKEGNVLRGSKETHYHVDCPNDGGIRIPGSVDWLNKYLKRKKSIKHLVKSHPAIQRINEYTPYLAKVKTLLLHESHDVNRTLSVDLSPKVTIPVKK